MNWIAKLNFKKAIKEILKDEKEGKDFCLDPLRFEDISISSVKEKVIESCVCKVGKTHIESLIEVDSPKSNFIIRPCARPNILDWVIYQSIVNFIGENIYESIPDCSYSFNIFREQFKRSKKKRRMDHWLDFDNKALEDSKKYKYMLVTDITSFFENISLNVLRERLLTLSNNGDYVPSANFLIENILKPWTAKNKIRDFGLPQGPMASSILADIFLYSVDKEMKKNRITFIRYMDDMRVFTKTKGDLKLALKKLVKALRELKLNLNAKKTDIYETDDVESLKKVFDSEKGRLNLIEQAFKSKKLEQVVLVIPSLNELLPISKDIKNAFRERHIKFFISHKIDLMKFELLEKKEVEELNNYFIGLLEDKPYLTNIICWFLLSACWYVRALKSQIKDKLLIFIRDTSKNIYEWQEMWILDTLRQLNNFTLRDLKSLKRNVNAHELCQGQLALILGQCNNPDYKEELLNKIKTSGIQNDQIRYFALAIQEMHKDVKMDILGKIPEYFKDYLSRLKNPRYGFIYSPSRIDLDIEYYSDYY